MNKKRLQFKNEDDWVVYKKNENERMRVIMKANYDDRIERGLCHKCSKPCSTNPHTGKPYHACFNCRRKRSRNGGMADT